MNPFEKLISGLILGATGTIVVLVLWRWVERTRTNRRLSKILRENRR